MLCNKILDSQLLETLPVADFGGRGQVVLCKDLVWSKDSLFRIKFLGKGTLALVLVFSALFPAHVAILNRGWTFL